MIPVIHSEREYAEFLERIDALWDAPGGSEAERELERLAAAVQAYESARRRMTMPPPRGGALVAYVLKERGWSQRELSRRLGWSSGRVSEVISGKRSLTLDMVRSLSAELNIDPRLLVHSEEEDDASHVWVRVPTSIAHDLLAQGGQAGLSLDDMVGQLLASAAIRLRNESAAMGTLTNVLRFNRVCGPASVQSFDGNEVAA